MLIYFKKFRNKKKKKKKIIAVNFFILLYKVNGCYTLLVLQKLNNGYHLGLYI